MKRLGLLFLLTLVLMLTACSVPVAAPDATATAVSATAPTETPKSKLTAAPKLSAAPKPSKSPQIVNYKDYFAAEVGMWIGPDAGEVYYEKGVQIALKDEATDEMLFFVVIFIGDPNSDNSASSHDELLEAELARLIATGLDVEQPAGTSVISGLFNKQQLKGFPAFERCSYRIDWAGRYYDETTGAWG